MVQIKLSVALILAVAGAAIVPVVARPVPARPKLTVTIKDSPKDLKPKEGVEYQTVQSDKKDSGSSKQR